MLFNIFTCLVLYLLFRTGELSSGTLFTSCGQTYTHEKGVIHSPNFPNEFPTPISCDWIIEAAPQKKIILYFTQFYLNSSFTIWDMDYYDSKEKSFVNKRERGKITYEARMDFLVSRKRFVLIHFSTEGIKTNMHARVERYLMDVYGFNITYEIIPSSFRVKENTCSVHKCSFLGNCHANDDFSEYKCECFGQFYGDSCQYGEHCSPKHNRTTCYNGGSCRYHEGSKTNHCDCPPGFMGFMCEVPDFECQYLECTHMCKQDHHGTWHCVCHKGFNIASDNRTCLLVASFRVTVLMRLANTNSKTMLPENFCDELEDDIMKALNNSIETVHRFGCQQPSNNRERVLQLYFYCQNTDLQSTERALKQITEWGIIGGVAIDKSFLRYTVDPSLDLIDIRIDGYKHYVIQDGLMRVLCTARGSDNLKVRWFKDGYAFDTKLTNRNPWLRRITHTFDKTYLFYLNIDSVSFLDAGVFKCEVSDYGESQNKSILVNVLSPARVEIQPMSVTAKYGESISMKCMSPDDIYRKFGYKWFIDGHAVAGYHYNESTYNIFPVGLMLNIRTVTQTTTLTCQVQNAAGLVNWTARAYVLPRNQTVHRCQEQLLESVLWRPTPNAQVDVNRCPNGGGYTTRLCKCSESGICEWLMPDFADCQSRDVTQLYDELDLLCLGYQHTTINHVFQNLSRLVRDPKRKFHSGDINLISGILKVLFVHVATYPVMLAKPISIESLVVITDTLLEGIVNSTDAEQEKMVVCTNVLRLIDILAMCETPLVDFSDSVDIKGSYMEVHTRQMIPPELVIASNLYQATNETRYETTPATKIPGQRYSLKTVLEVRFYNFLEHLKTKTTKGATLPQHADLSDVYSVFQHPYHKDATEEVGLVELHHIQHVFLQGMADNRTRCIVWRFSRRQQTKGFWDTDGCSVIYNTNNSTLCRCALPGHFRLILLSQNQISDNSKDEDIKGTFILQMAFTLSLPSLLVTMISYIIIWRRLPGELCGLHFNFTICLIAVNVVFILCRGHSQSQMSCFVGQILLQLLYLAAHSFLFADALHLLVGIGHKFKKVDNWAKYVTIGWGIPVLVTSTVFGASEIFGYRAQCSKTCWLYREQWEFYGYLIPMLFITTAHVAVMLVCVVLVRKWNSERMYMRRRQCLISIGKSLQLCVLVAVSSFLPMSIEHDEQIVQVYFLLLSNTLLGVLTLLYRVLFDNEVMQHLRQCWKSELTSDRNPNITKVRPRSVFDGFKTSDMNADPGVQSEVDSIAEYCFEVNRIKFTRERREQLSSLLGSSLNESSNYSSGTDTKESDVSTEASEPVMQTTVDVHTCDQLLQAASAAPCTASACNVCKEQETVHKCKKFAVKQSVLNSIYEVPDSSV